MAERLSRLVLPNVRKLAIILGSVLAVAILSVILVDRIVAERTRPGYTPISTGLDHVAISGFDSVSYWTEGKATLGSSQYVYVWNDATWRFTSAAHRDMFAADPERYAPQYGGYCGSHMTMGEMSAADPQVWAIVDGKLYMFASERLWRGWTEGGIARADQHWRALTGQ
jgi:hypothetical protein